MAHPSSSSTQSSPASGGQNSNVQTSEHIAVQPPVASDRDPAQVISTFRSAIAAGEWPLDMALQGIAEAAQVLTGASGAALAMRQSGLIICQARSGETAPELGTRLSLDSGISGECLRTGQPLYCDDTNNDSRVDAEVCRTLGIRSLAVVPLRAQHGVIGILEAFSGLPHSFPEKHLELLDQLAELAVVARYRSVEPLTRARSVAVPEATTDHPGLFSRASPRLVEIVAALREYGFMRRVLVLGTVAAIALIGGLSWLLLRGHSTERNLPSATAQVAATPAGPSASPASPTTLVWNAQDSASIPAKSTKPSPTISASAVRKQAGLREPEESTPPEVVHRSSISDQNIAQPPASPPPPAPTTHTVDQTSAPENAPTLAALPPTSASPLGSVLSVPVAVPPPSVRVSQGLTEGSVIRRVEPQYPSQARTLRLEGTVFLKATVAEDGTVRDIKVVSGPPVLARAAVEAVSRWRYRPYRLNGKPIAMEVEIRTDFKLP
jgi:TonB family protein